MALTYRSEKGSALTNTELDNNFRHFTGSHSITGSLTVSGSVIPADVSGTLGTADNPWKSLYVDQGTIYFISGSSSGSMSWNSSSGFVFDSSSLQSLDVSGNSTFSGSVTISGSNTLTNIGPFVNEGTATISGSLFVSASAGAGLEVRQGTILAYANGKTSNVSIGYRAGRYSEATESVNIGESAGVNASSSAYRSINIGYLAGQFNAQPHSFFAGYYAGYLASGSHGIGIGLGAGQNMKGDHNIGIGYGSMHEPSGSFNVALGKEAGISSNYGVPEWLTGSNNTFLGTRAAFDTNNRAVSNATAVGANTIVAQSNTVILGSGADVGIGTPTPGAMFHVTGSVSSSGNIYFDNLSNTTTPNIVGYDTSTGQLSYYSTSSFGSVSGSVGNLQQVTDVGATTTNAIEVAGLTSNGNAEFSGSVKVYSGSVSIGHTDSYKIVSTLNNIYSGSLSWTESNAFKLLSNQSYYNRLHISNSVGPQLVLGDEYNSINIGSGAGGANIGNASRFGNSVAIGNEALANLTISNGQVAIGEKAGYSDLSSYSVFVGVRAGANLDGNGNTNTAIGSFALSSSLPVGQFGNTALGHLAGAWNSGSKNTYLGQEAGGALIVGGTHYPSSSNSIFIGYRAGWNPNTGSDGDNMIVINAKPDSNNYGGGKGSNTAVLGNSDITHTYLYGTITEPSGLHVATSSAYNTDINFKNLPTSSTGLDTGSLWLSGSDGAGSQFLMVYNP